MTRIKLTGFLPILLLAFVSCAPKAPIPILEYGSMDASENSNLLILLRGRGGTHKDFAKHGIINEVRKREIPFDIVAPAAHFGYYRSETLPERLKLDIIDPAREKGYRNIWIAGFSMGGLGSLFLLREYGRVVDGVILISPFMGWWWNSILDEIEVAGGIPKWAPPLKPNGSWQNRIWRWVREYSGAREKYPEIYLGFGTDDPLTGKGPGLLSGALRSANHFSVPGSHNYSTFKKIWAMHMDRLEGKLKALPQETESAPPAVKEPEDQLPPRS